MLEKLKIAWDCYNYKWSVCFKAADYYSSHGDLNVKSNYQCSDGIVLSTWLSNLRSNYKKGLLSPEQIKDMESIGMVWQPAETVWNKGYEYAEEYFKENGDLRVSQKYVTEDGFKLGQWISGNKSAYRKNSLSDERVKKLELIGIVWNEVDVKWNMAIDHLKNIIRNLEIMIFLRITYHPMVIHWVNGSEAKNDVIKADN